MDVQKAVEKILKVSPSVRVVSVVDLKGKVVFSDIHWRVKLVFPNVNQIINIGNDILAKTLATVAYLLFT